MPKNKEDIQIQIGSLQKTVNTLALLVVILIFVFGSYIFYTEVISPKKEGNVAGTLTTANKPSDSGLTFIEDYPTLQKNDHIRGNKNAEIILFEYSDYECPFCKRFHTTGKQLLEKYGNRAAWVYRHFPLDQLHSKARDEAIAAECVAKLGGNEAFWKYTDTIFDTTPSNNGLDLTKLPVYAAQAGVDQLAFLRCYDNKETKDIVEQSLRRGTELGVRGTPGNFIVNVKTGRAVFVPGALPFEQIKIVVEKVSSKR